MTYRIQTGLRDSIRSNLSAISPTLVTQTGLRRAAVAATLINRDDSDEAAFILTRRSSKLRRHGGQWALPGGRIDTGETAEEACLRELSEEVGVNVDHNAILGRMDDYVTRSGFCISSFVIWAGSVDALNINPDEVAFAHRIPVNDLFYPENPVLSHIPESHKPVLSMFIESLGHEVYAPTAAVLLQLRDVAISGVASPVDGYEQPQFAWS